MKITVENQEILKDFQKELSAIDYKTPLIATAEFAIEKALERVQSGRGSEGNLMITKSRSRTGYYSRVYGEKRRKLGKSTSRISLNLTGNTQKYYKVITKQKRKVEGGFSTNRSTEIARYNEDYFGDAYYLSQSEITQSIDFFNKLTNKML